jgi:hypothetical protein
MARPTLKFDDKDARFVAALTKYGVSAVNIARELDVDPKTLQRHFGEVIATAMALRETAKIDALWERAENREWSSAARALPQDVAGGSRGIRLAPFPPAEYLRALSPAANMNSRLRCP